MLKNLSEIPGLEDFEGYAISDDGMVWSYKSNRWLKNCIRSNGYYGINLKGKSFLIHRLVALAFVPNPTNQFYVDHRNSDKTNNSAANLRWCSLKENCNFDNVNRRKEARIPRRVHCIETGEVFESIRAAARAIDASDTQIARVCKKGRCKTVHGLHFEFVD